MRGLRSAREHTAEAAARVFLSRATDTPDRVLLRPESRALLRLPAPPSDQVKKYRGECRLGGPGRYRMIVSYQWTNGWLVVARDRFAEASKNFLVLDWEADVVRRGGQPGILT